MNFQTPLSVANFDLVRCLVVTSGRVPMAVQIRGSLGQDPNLSASQPQFICGDNSGD